MDLNTPLSPYWHYVDGTCEKVNAPILKESSLLLTVNGTAWLNFACTPLEQEDLALGFLYNEGIIDSINEVENIHLCANETGVDVWLNHPAKPPERWNRASGCTGSLTSVDVNTARGKSNAGASGEITCKPWQILDLMKSLYQSQNLYLQTRGLHCSALSNGRDLVAISEDIGRHNTLDKLAGKRLRAAYQDHTDNKNNAPVLLTTGRITSEMVLKTHRLGAVIGVSRTSPSSLAVQIAAELGITIVGYAGRGEFNVYTFPERLGLGQRQETRPPN